MIIVIVVVVTLLVAVGYALARGTFSWSGPGGSTSITSGSPPEHAGRRTDLKTLLPHLFEGKRFEWLSVCQKGSEKGFSISKVGAGIEFMFTFNLVAEKADQAAIRKLLSDEGIVPTEDYDINVGMGPANEERMVLFVVPADESTIIRLTDKVMDLMFGRPDDLTFSAGHSDDIAKRNGLSWRPTIDRLSGLLH